MQGKEAVKKIRTVFHGFDFSLWSKVRKPRYYGVQLTPAAKALISPKKDNRAKANRYTWRCGNALRDRLQTTKKALGILTDQEAITVAVLEWVERQEQGDA